MEPRKDVGKKGKLQKDKTTQCCKHTDKQLAYVFKITYRTLDNNFFLNNWLNYSSCSCCYWCCHWLRRCCSEGIIQDTHE
jgi:hypothetical protein